MTETEKKVKSSAPHVAYGTGKRKSSIAKVWVHNGKGTVTINKLSAADYLQNEIKTNSILKAIQVLGLEGKYDIKISTFGGGKSGQADACRLGIARALLELNESFRKTLRDNDLLTRDPREKERKKYGRKKARKGYQFRKR